MKLAYNRYIIAAFSRGSVEDFQRVGRSDQFTFGLFNHSVFLLILLHPPPHSVERYDPSKDAWEMVAPMADKRINFGVGVMLGFIFVVGGHNGVSHLSSIERYDPHQNQWTACRPMNEPRTGEFTSCFS